VKFVKIRRTTLAIFRGYVIDSCLKLTDDSVNTNTGATFWKVGLNSNEEGHRFEIFAL
jgi:hypothetical protein